MKSLLGASVLLMAALAAAQAPTGQPVPPGTNPGPGGPPPTSTPTTFPKEGKTPPNKEKSPAEDAADRLRLQREIEKTIRGDARLKGADVKALVNAKDVVVSGTVKSEGQRLLALHMAEAYAMGREIVDKLVVKGS